MDRVARLLTGVGGHGGLAQQQVAQRGGRGGRGPRVDHVAARLGHLGAVHGPVRVAHEAPRRVPVDRHQERRPVYPVKPDK